MFKQKFEDWYEKQVGWSGTIMIGIMLGLALWGQVERINLRSNPAYTKGILTARHEGAKGSWYWEFAFYAGQNGYKSSVPILDCIDCNVGDSVIVRYQFDNPDNNGLVSKEPSN